MNRRALPPVVLAALVALHSGPADAQAMPGSPFAATSTTGGGGGGSSDPACELAGGVDCTMVGTVQGRTTSQELAFTFSGDTDTGITWNNGNSMCLRVNNADGWCYGDNWNPGVHAFYGAQNPAPYLRSVATLGSAATPGYAFVGATTTGLFTLTGGGLGLASNAEEGLRVGYGAENKTIIHFTDGTTGQPAIIWSTDLDTGIARNTLGTGAIEIVDDGVATVAFVSTRINPRVPIITLDGTTTDPAVQIGDEDAGLYYDDAANTLFLQSPGSDSTSGSIALVSDTAGAVNIASGTNGWALYDAATVNSLISGGGGSGVDVWDASDVEVRGPTITLGATASPYTLDAIRTPNKTASGSAALFQVPRSVSTTPLANPTCDSSNAGALTYRDDTDDAVVGALCVCNASSGNAYAWRLLDLTTACPL